MTKERGKKKNGKGRNGIGECRKKLRHQNSWKRSKGLHVWVREEGRGQMAAGAGSKAEGHGEKAERKWDQAIFGSTPSSVPSL